MSHAVGRRSFLVGSAAAIGAAAAAPAQAQEKAAPIILPPAGKRILLSCKLGMIAKKDGRQGPDARRAAEAGGGRPASTASISTRPARSRRSRPARPCRSRASSCTTPSTTPTGSSG